MAGRNFSIDGNKSGKCDASVQTQRYHHRNQQQRRQQPPNENNSDDDDVISARLPLLNNKRSSFQDVEEALNSQLWLPYEYRTNNRRLGDYSDDLEEPSPNEDHNRGEEDITWDTNNNSADDGDRDIVDRVAECADLNLCTEMVNNLKPSSATGQCEKVNSSREPLSSDDGIGTTATASRLKSQASLLELFGSGGGTAGVGRDSGCCDVFLDHYLGDMQIELAPGTSTGTDKDNTININNNNNVLNIATGDNNIINNRYHHHHHHHKSSNLSSVNVVGLPSSFAHHHNNAWINNNNNKTAGSPGSDNNNRIGHHYHHQKSSSQIESAASGSQVPRSDAFTHYRSASVPKSMQMGPNQTQDLNVSNVNVNFYRAVPVNVVSSLPAIQCLNTSFDNNKQVVEASGNNVSNVQIMPLGHNNNNTSPMATATQVTVHASDGTPSVKRTFTSTEAQTDDLLLEDDNSTQIRHSETSSGVVGGCELLGRERRRRERRERKQHHHQRRVNNSARHHVGVGGDAGNAGVDNNGTQSDDNNGFRSGGLPDLLNSHQPPPYAPPSVMVPHPVGVLQAVVPSPPPPSLMPTPLAGFVPPPPPLAAAVPLVRHHQVAVGGGGQGPAGGGLQVGPPPGLRFTFPLGGFRGGRFITEEEQPPKGCCGLLTWKPGSLRWFIAVIALVAVCCVLVGTALGAMRPSGRDHLTVSLLMIGVGIVLVTVSGIAWKLTSHDSSTCRSMLGLGSNESVDVCARRFVPRLPPSYGRPHHPYAAMMYPEFQYRPPPPSYQASMQEYRLRLLLLDRGNGPHHIMRDSALQNNAVSPPPTYRSHAGSLLRLPLTGRGGGQSEYSCPPSYQSGGRNRNRANRPSSVLHSREQSLSESNACEDSVVNVVSILGGTEDDVMALDDLDSLKIMEGGEAPGNNNKSDLSNPLRMLLHNNKGNSCGDLDKDGNLVTIVQTNDRNPVIVTVSGSSHLDNFNSNREEHLHHVQITSEMEVLAHL